MPSSVAVPGPPHACRMVDPSAAVTVRPSTVNVTSLMGVLLARGRSPAEEVECHRRLHGVVGGVSEPADRRVGHRPADVVEQVEVGGRRTVAIAVGADAGGEAVDGFLLADGADAAGHALAARLLTEERGDPLHLIDEVDGSVV